MNEEELRAFLTERKLVPDKIDVIVDGLSAKEVQRFAAQYGQPIPDDAKAEEIALKSRKQFAEHIEMGERGSIPTPYHGL